MYIKEKNKGITLISLVITVIVLLILAGVALTMLSGENGIMTRAKTAREQHEDAQEQEENRPAGMENVMDEYLGNTAPGSTTGGSGSGSGNIVVAGGTATGGRKTYSDGTDTATIPEGWTVSGVPGETTISTGLVIYDIPSSVDTTAEGFWTATKPNGNLVVHEDYNQFVWVPVPDYSKFTRNDWNNWNGTSEPTQLTTTELESWEYSESTTVDPTGKYGNMCSSVETNHGFYIARYEAGTTNTDTTKTSGIRGDVVSRKNAKVYNNIGWNNDTSSSTRMTTTTGGAVAVATGMNTPNVTSTLCYGVQWDAVMRWISQDNNLKGYITNSTGKGNYYDSDDSNNPGNTGIYEMKNIYDMAGNVWEWTMEASYTCYRVFRGGYSDSTGSVYPVSSRFYCTPGDSYDIIGFRVTLYL